MSKREITRGTIQDQVSTTEERDAEKSTERVMAKAQLVGLGSVLIATVSFAAAFTLPGGTNQDTGTPILGRKYVFKAYVLADFAAFFLSFLSTMVLVDSSSVESRRKIEINVDGSLRYFNAAAKCMVLTLALGLYLVLGPVVKTGKVVLGFSIYLITADPRWSTWENYIFLFQSTTRRIILELFSDADHKKPDWKAFAKAILRAYKALAEETLSFGLRFLAPIVVPIFLIFMFALI